MKENDSLSRRQWLGKITVPAMAAGTTLLATNVHASPTDDQKEDKLKGARIYNVQDFGAKGDGITLNTKSIQAAIDKCAAEQGGTVLIPGGDFMSGTLELKSNVTLHIAAAGKLLGSPKREDYTAGKGVPPSNGNIVFLFAVNAHHLSIEGKGTIDGNGLAFYNGKGDNTGPGQNGVGGNFDRPHLGIFYQCENLRMDDVFCTASAYHCFRILSCKHVHIDGIRIYNRVNRNNDGFHFNNSEYVHIINCDVQCQDDACALFGSNKFVTISNCSFSTRWSIFRFGGGESQNITVTNCLIYDTYGCPIKISAGNARIENLTFSNIIMRNVTGPIGIGFSGPSRNNSNNNPQPTTKPFIRNIVFNGIRATVAAKPIDHPDIHFGVTIREGEKNSCITLNAMNEYYLENISFTDVHVTYAGGGTAEQAAKEVPKVAAEYFGVWDPLPGGPPAYGLYARNVKGLTLQNVRFGYEQADARPAIILDNVEDASINGLSVMGSAGNEVMRLINSKDVLLTATKILTPAAVFLKIEGAESAGIIADGGDLRKASQKTVFDKGALKDAVTLRG
ncbi:glycoside hydrolase family 28 protein [Lacibacter sp.]|uniref:glycoside hydrolase family 28 protein n=1 Tax=Lacibacter sp. TaxID=1915409 RepID=UPI002B4AEE4E|nr:glycosyl hydrolase family 28 protein [Lacibacter sp.]HLP36059.1 glycosyl hydrolase family 28 protein [Lacibacter sp.]